MSISTLAILENLTDHQRGEISIKLFCSEGVTVDISEESDNNEELVKKLVDGIPPWEHVKRKNVIINHVIKLGCFRMISAVSYPFFINSKGEITQVRTEIYLEAP